MKWHGGRNERCGRGCQDAVPEIIFPTPFPFAHFLPALPMEAVLQSQGKLQAQTWRATQTKAAQLELKPWLEERTAASPEGPVTVNYLSTVWRGRGGTQTKALE